MPRLPLLLAALVASLALAAPAGAKTPRTTYYVSLGDSLSVGVQPKPPRRVGGPSENTGQGYADQLYALLHKSHPGLKLVKLGCGFATTVTITSGGRPCAPARRTPYANKSAKTSQIAYAEAFLRRHRGRVRYVTLDIGANDVQVCARNGTIDSACLSAGIKAIGTNVPKIARRLRKAGGSSVHMAGMNLYDPFLQAYLTGNQGLAAASQALAKQVNTSLAQGYRAGRFRVVDVAGAFRTYTPFSQTTTLAPYGRIPVAVADICRLTWMCKVQNIHANKTGYGVIARAFRKVF